MVARLEMVSVEEGLATVQSYIPEIVRVEPKNLTFEGTNRTAIRLGVGSDKVVDLPWLAGHAFKTRTGLDATMLDKLSSELKLSSFRYLVGRTDDPFVFKVRDGKVVGVPKKEEEIKDPRPLLDAVSNLTPIGIANIIRAADRIGFGVILDRVFKVQERPDEVIRSGIYVSLNGKLEAGTYNYRQVCSNGMMAYKPGMMIPVEADNVHGVLASLQDQAATFTENFTKLAAVKVENSGGLVGRLQHERILNSVQVNQVIARIAELGTEATEFDLVNLITSFQHTQPNRLDWLYSGGRAVGHFHSAHCERCGSHT